MCLCGSEFPLLRKTPVRSDQGYPNSLVLTSSPLSGPSFQRQSHSEGLGFRAPTWEFVGDPAQWAKAPLPPQVQACSAALTSGLCHLARALVDI